MGDIVEFFRKSDFDPETVKVLCDAYDRASPSTTTASPISSRKSLRGE